jgi:hypothetical protein
MRNSEPRSEAKCSQPWRAFWGLIKRQYEFVALRIIKRTQIWPKVYVRVFIYLFIYLSMYVLCIYVCMTMCTFHLPAEMSVQIRHSLDVSHNICWVHLSSTAQCLRHVLSLGLYLKTSTFCPRNVFVYVRTNNDYLSIQLANPIKHLKNNITSITVKYSARTAQ